MQETERQLIGAIRAGDREALRRLYERFSRFAMGVVLRYVPEREDALDITQDSFINILTNISTFEKLDISEKASATIFSRAKRKLAKMMKEYLDSQGI